LVFLALAGTIVFVAALLPLVSLFGQAGQAMETGLESSRLWLLLLRSVALATSVTLVALIFGTPLGFLFARTRFPFRRTVFALHALPMFLPAFLSALGWFHLLGRQGLIGNETTATLLFSELGCVFVLALAFTPIVTTLCALGIGNVDPALEESARLVARPWAVATRILIPAAWPAILLAALLVFTLAFEELGVPMFLRVDVYPAAVFARLGGIDYAPGEAALLLLPLVPIVLLLILTERTLLGRRVFAVLGLRYLERQPVKLSSKTTLHATFPILAAGLGALPLGTLAWRAWFLNGFRDLGDWIGSSIFNSLVTAGLAATVITLTSIILGHALARRYRGASIIDSGALFAFFTPAAVLGVGLVAVWNRGETQYIYGSLAILVIAFVARYAVVGIRTLAASFAQSHASYEEAAKTTGAGYLRRILGIVLPMHWKGVVTGWLLVFVFCLRDMETAVLLYPPGGEPLTVRIFTLEANGPEGTVAALSIVHIGLTCLFLTIGSILLRKGAVR